MSAPLLPTPPLRSTLPLLGREGELRLLADLREKAQRSNSMALGMIRGGEGSGRSTLARVAAEAARQAGLREQLWVHHGPELISGHGIAGALLRRMGLEGLPASEARVELADQLDELGKVDEAFEEGLAMAMGLSQRRPARPGEREATLLRALHLLGAGRGLVMVVDEASHARDDLALLAALLEERKRWTSPLLILLVDSPTPAHSLDPLRPLWRQVLEAGLPAVQVPLEPLGPTSLEELARQQWRLNPAAAAVAARGATSVLHLVQGVLDARSRGQVYPGPGGTLLAIPGWTMPPRLEQVWSSRLAWLVQRHGPLLRDWMELGAVLGREVRRERLQAAGAALQLGPAPVAAPLVAAELIVGDDQRWSYVHETLRQTILAEARQRGRLPELHRACAEALREEGGLESLRQAAIHDAEGDPSRAVHSLLAATREATAHGEFGAAIELLDRHEALVARGHEAERAAAWIIRSEVWRRRGELEAADAWARRAEEGARRLGLEPLLAEAQRAGAEVALSRGEEDLAHRRFTSARRLFLHHGDTSAAAACWIGQAQAARHLGRLAEARRALEEALDEARELGQPALQARAWLELGLSQLAARDLEDAAEALQEAFDLYGALGDRLGVADCSAALAELARLQGRLELAELSQQRARAEHKALGSGAVVLPAIGLGILLDQRGQAQEALQELYSARATLERQGRRGYLDRIDALLLSPLARLGDGGTWERRWGAVQRLMRSHGPADADLAEAAERAMLRCGERAGQPDWISRALRAGELALVQRRRLEDGLGAQRLRSRMGRLPRGPIPLGSFDLIEPVGAGGMSQVWRALHRDSGLTVAVKVLTGELARREECRTALLDEIRAMASLDHAHIGLVLDHGEVGPAAEAATGGSLTAGNPWFAMEYGHGGSITPLAGQLGWVELRPLLCDLLDALAHAHARGVVHRDIKPQNVLMHDPRDLRGGIKLVDFGLAHALSGEQGDSRLAGTPLFMAPEQFRGRWRDYGPWTDLYALGGMVVALLTGRSPFPPGDVEELRRAHLEAPVPQLEAELPLPAGFDRWLRWMMAKETHRRFRRAADALAALYQLEDSPSHPPRRSQGTEELSVNSSCTVSLDGGPLLELDSGHVVYEPPPPVAPPSPTWRGGQSPPPTRLRDAGLGLFGLRPAPICGRLKERDRLWDVLAEARAQDQARVVLISGGAGFGKSRLARWLCDRAHETGSATPVRAVHGPMAGPQEGLSGLLVSMLGVSGLSPAQTLARIERTLRHRGVEDPDLVGLLARLVQPAVEQQATLSRAERCAAMRRVMEAWTRERSLLVWLEDAHWGAESLDFAHHLLDAQDTIPAPITLLLTMRDDLLSERPAESRLLGQLIDRAGVVRIDLGPLADEEQSEMVRGLLAMEERSLRAIIQRTGGNPLFAEQLIGDWVSRGALRPGPDGFALREEELSVGIAHTDHWIERIERLLADLPDSARLALELAALLGSEVDRDEWIAACQAAEQIPPPGLMDRLIRHRLLSPSPKGWSFAHRMLGEALETLARREGRLTDHHRACALVLRGNTSAEVVARRGHHELLAGQLVEAQATLLEGARLLLCKGDCPGALLALDRWEAAGRSLGLPPEDQRWASGRALRLRVLIEAGRLSDAHQQAEALAFEAARAGWAATQAEALRLQAIATQGRGDRDGGRPLLEAALQRFLSLQDRHSASLCRLSLAHIARQRGDHRQAHSLLAEAHSTFERGQDHFHSATTLHALGALAQANNDLASAARLYEHARHRFRQCASQSGMAAVLTSMGDLARHRNDWSEAERCYREAGEVLRGLGSSQALFLRMRMALAQLQRERWREALAALEQCREMAQRQGRRAQEGQLHALALVALATEVDAPRWEHHAEQARHLIEETAGADVELAHHLELGARRAALIGFPERARPLLLLSAEQWSRLSRPAELQRVRAALAGLDASPASPSVIG